MDHLRSQTTAKRRREGSLVEQPQQPSPQPLQQPLHQQPQPNQQHVGALTRPHLSCERQAAGSPGGPTFPLTVGGELATPGTRHSRSAPAMLALTVQRSEQALVAEPLDFDRVRVAAQTLCLLGRHAQAEQLLSWHIELHPVAGPAYSELADIMLMAGHPPDNLHPWRHALDACQSPRFTIHRDLLSGEPDFDMDDEELDLLAPMERAMFELLKMRSSLACSPDACNAAMKQIPRAADQARVFGLAGDKVQVIACLKQAIASGQLPLEVTHSPFMRKLINDPDLLQLLQSVGEAPHQLDHIPFDISPPAQLAPHRQRLAARTAALALRAQQAQDAFNANPHDHAAVRGAVRQLRCLGRINEAEAVLRWHIDGHPAGGLGHVELARLLLRSGRLAQARELEAEAVANGYRGAFFTQLAALFGEFAYLGGDSDDPDVCFARAINQYEQQHSTSVLTGQTRNEPRPRAIARALDRLADADKALIAAGQEDTQSALAMLQRASHNGPWPLDITYALQLHSAPLPLTPLSSAPLQSDADADSAADDWRWLPLMSSIGEAPQQLAAIAVRLRLPPESEPAPEVSPFVRDIYVARIEDRMDLALVACKSGWDGAGSSTLAILCDLGRAQDAGLFLQSDAISMMSAVSVFAGLTRACTQAGKLDEALVAAHAAIELGAPRDILLQALLLAGRYEEARPLMAGTPRWVDHALLEFSLGNIARSDEAIARLTSLRDRIMAHAWRGDAQRVAQLLDEAIEADELPLYLTFEPYMRRVMADPQVLEMLERIGESPEALGDVAFSVRVG
jgi:tetratricopeptide (TPR) repeat protein